MNITNTLLFFVDKGFSNFIKFYQKKKKKKKKKKVYLQAGLVSYLHRKYKAQFPSYMYDNKALQLYLHLVAAYNMANPPYQLERNTIKTC